MGDRTSPGNRSNLLRRKPVGPGTQTHGATLSRSLGTFR
jgi:hypothetical protein